MNTTKPQTTEADVTSFLMDACDRAVKKLRAQHASVSFSVDTQFRDKPNHFAHLRFNRASVCGAGQTVEEAFADAARQCETPERLLEEKRAAFEEAKKQLAAAEAFSAEAP